MYQLAAVGAALVLVIPGCYLYRWIDRRDSMKRLLTFFALFAVALSFMLALHGPAQASAARRPLISCGNNTYFANRYGWTSNHSGNIYDGTGLDTQTTYCQGPNSTLVQQDTSQCIAYNSTTGKLYEETCGVHAWQEWFIWHITATQIWWQNAYDQNCMAGNAAGTKLYTWPCSTANQPTQGWTPIHP